MRALLGITVVLLTGCATTHTLTLPADPIRRVDALVVYDPSYKLAKVQECVNTSSLRLENEFGIRLVPVEFRAYAWEKSNDTDELIRQIYHMNLDDQYEMVIGITCRTPTAAITDQLLGGWVGVTDDDRRRYIVVKSPDSYTLTHELLHSFVFAFDHEWRLGQLSAIQINPIPFVPGASMRSETISNAVYAEVMRNKWRNLRDTVTR